MVPCVFVPSAAANIHHLYRQGITLHDVYEMPSFRAVCRGQFDYRLGKGGPKEHGNGLLPCPLREHQGMGRELIDTYHPQPEDPAAALQDDQYGDGLTETKKIRCERSKRGTCDPRPC